ncbi:4-aminobutyrate aminotransferase [Devosia sp. LC5]|uniref:aminotransferase class III-fold pyridoxal phosphate-dependent enzyme n=1 Tax=Devosia sp. LC5 TaxID=1502724 RepID=UPI0004E29397|nr:aminotransferase class III-fold pyridoxal phosphate-dependent enzyme [Devosia sp. LC5]KFC68218.1 4-aminobutyrate aminotransferase [Devosia sp. LC5]
MIERDVLGTASAALVGRDAAVFFHQDGSSPCLAALRHVSGSWIEDMDGRRYLDLHGNTAHHIGHAHPELVAVLKAQLDELTFSPRRYANEPATELAELLTAQWPDGPAKVLFTTGGSDAIELAMKLARVVTGRSATVSLEGCYHGHGLGAFGLSRAEPDRRLGSFLPDRVHVRPYWKYGAAAMIEDIERALRETPGGVAAIIAEPIRSNCHVPSLELWPEVRRLCDAAGTLLIFDEIPSGLGKTGRFFAFEHFDARPDMVVLGKALGGGMLPIAAVLADARFDIAPELDLGHYTHEKNPLTTRAALTCLRIILRDRLPARTARLEQAVREGVAELARSMPAIRSVRGKGLLLAIELDQQALAGVSEARLLQALLDHGVSTTTKGRDALGFSPPMTISDDELVTALNGIAIAVRSVI